MIFAQLLTYYRFNYFGQKLGFSILQKIPENQKLAAFRAGADFQFQIQPAGFRNSSKSERAIPP